MPAGTDPILSDVRSAVFCKGNVPYINRLIEKFCGLVEDGSNQFRFGWCALATAFEFWRNEIVYGLLYIEYECLVTCSDDIITVIRQRFGFVPTKPQTAKEKGSKRQNQTSRVLASDSNMKAGKPIHQSAINRWKVNKKHRALFFKGTRNYKIVSVALIAVMSFPAARLRVFGGYSNRQQ